jgi:CheY-like chemotaxis protein
MVNAMDAVRVWIVDDNTPDVFLMQLALQRTGLPMEVTVMTDGQNATNSIEQCRAGAIKAPDIVLLDLHLPKVGGLQVLKTIRETPELKRTRVAMFTSSPVSEQDRDGKAVRVERWIHKPATLEKFLAEIGRTVRELIPEKGTTRV